MIRGIIKNDRFDIETKKSLIMGFKQLKFNDEKTNALIERKIQYLSVKKILKGAK